MRVRRANIKGDARRNYLNSLVDSGQPTNRRPEDLADSLSHEHRRAAGIVHPSLMGGEYLPDCLRGEVEIARIMMASATRDVQSIRARPLPPGNRRIRYRVVDEYNAEYTLDRSYSLRPLTLVALTRLMERAWYEGNYQRLVVGFLEFSADCGADADAYRHFLTISSDVHPELSACHEERIERWYRRWQAQRE